MSCLLIFDGNISTRDINSISVKDGSPVILFPLTSRQYLINQVVDRCHAGSSGKVEIIASSRIISEVADEIRNNYIEFIARLPERCRVHGKNLKEWFYYPDGGISLWWLSLIAEKNTLKSDSFRRLVQLYSVIRVIQEHNVRELIMVCRSQKLASVLKLYCQRNALIFQSLPNRKEPVVRGMPGKFPVLNALAAAVLYLLGMLKRWIQIKRFMKTGLRNRLNKGLNNPLLMVTYYPNIDVELASAGVFKNKYYPSLQTELEGQGRDIIWVAVYVQNTGISFHESLQYAGNFVARGYHFVFLEEFLTLTSFVKALWGILRGSIRFKKIEKELVNCHDFTAGVSIYPIFKDDWYTSFFGITGVQGFLYMDAFKRMFQRLPPIKNGVYYCEMHAWEKVLLAARKKYAGVMRLFAYQHATVSRMVLNYFNHPAELQEADSEYALPKPDKIACDGEVPYRYFTESGWREDELTIVEAIRYHHLKNIAPRDKKSRDNIVLVAFSISIEESVAILNMIYEGLKDVTGVKVWLKPHPFLPMDVVLNRVNLSLSGVHFEIKNGAIDKLLPEVKVVIVNESGVALEALAYGCRVLTLNLPDVINMSPLHGIQSRLVRYADSAEALQEAVGELIKESGEAGPQEIGKIVNQFFYFNRTSDKPQRFLDLLS